MQGMSVYLSAIVLCLSAALTHCNYQKELSQQNGQLKEKVTNLHFYFNGILSGNNPSAVMVAHANNTKDMSSPSPFGSIFAIDDPLTETPEPNSRVIRNLIIDGERELVVVGGRAKFRMAREFAKLKTVDFNVTNGDVVIEYNVTVSRY